MSELRQLIQEKHQYKHKIIMQDVYVNYVKHVNKKFKKKHISAL